MTTEWLETIAAARGLVSRAALARRVAAALSLFPTSVSAPYDHAPDAHTLYTERQGLEHEACRLEMQAERMLLDLYPLGGYRAVRRILGLPVSAGIGVAPPGLARGVNSGGGIDDRSIDCVDLGSRGPAVPVGSHLGFGLGGVVVYRAEIQQRD